MSRTAVITIAFAGLLLVQTSDQIRVDNYDARGRRQGYSIIDPKSGRVDQFDSHSRRQGLVKTLDGIGLHTALDLKSSADLLEAPATSYTPLRQFATLSSRATTTTPVTVHSPPSRLY
jgi:hypothetical protein